MFVQKIKNLIESIELKTVSNSFGALKLDGKAPVFPVLSITAFFLENYSFRQCRTSKLLTALACLTNADEFKYVIGSTIRFAFLIELTNLGITSTKLKTRWMEGFILKTHPASYQNYRGLFNPGNDERSSSFEVCFEVFNKVIDLIIGSQKHLDALKLLTLRRAVPYESVITYHNYNLNPVHTSYNVQLVELNDIQWLIKARPIIYSILTKKNKNKIKTKCYKTDRSQTGEVQTNRAKRWECLAMDFQHATLEECWSVERKLLNDLVHFNNFPEDVKQKLIEYDLFGDGQTIKCPITLAPMLFEEFQKEAEHGESPFQVGHISPLKGGGRHVGSNIAWITDDGNRIQGDLDLEATRNLIRIIAERMNR